MRWRGIKVDHVPLGIPDAIVSIRENRLDVHVPYVYATLNYENQ